MSVSELTINNNYDLNIHDFNLNGTHLLNGQLVIGVTGSPPLTGNITSNDGSVTISNGPGSINLSVMNGSGTLTTLTTTNPTTNLGATHWNMENGNEIRWQHGLITVESGANSGSNYVIYAIADDGVTRVGAALVYNRSTLDATFGASVLAPTFVINAAKSVSINTLAQSQNVLVNFPNAGTFETNFILQDAAAGQTINSQLFLSSIAGNQVVITAGTQALSGLTLNNGQLVIGNTGSAPVAANITSNGGTIAVTNGAGYINIDVTTPANTFNNIITTAGTSGGGTNHWALETNNKIRWEWGLKNLESGSNAGSDIILSCFDDLGSSIIYQPLVITRSTGVPYFTQGEIVPLSNGITFGNTSGHKTVISAADPSPNTNVLTIPASDKYTDTFCLLSATQNLANKSIVDSADSTKNLQFNLSGNTSGTGATLSFATSSNRTYSFPNITDTIMTTNANQTVTYKTFNGCSLENGLVYNSTYTYTSTAAQVAIQLSESGDPSYRFQGYCNGNIGWGNGSTSVDTIMQRTSAAALTLSGASVSTPATLLVNNITAAVSGNNLSLSGNGTGLVQIASTGLELANITSGYSPDVLNYCEYTNNGAITGSNPISPAETMTFQIYRIGRSVTVEWSTYIFNLGNASIQFVGAIPARFVPSSTYSTIVFGRNTAQDQPILLNVYNTGGLEFFSLYGQPFDAQNGGFYKGSVTYIAGY